jgi:hypothetical protein
MVLPLVGRVRGARRLAPDRADEAINVHNRFVQRFAA